MSEHSPAASNNSVIDSDRSLERLLRALFVRLDAHNLRYCVLRNYEKLPCVVGNDLDLLVDAQRRNDAIRLVTELLRKEWRLIKRVDRFDSVMLFATHSSTRAALKIDLFWAIQWHSFTYASAEVTLEHRQRFGDFWVAAPGSEAAISLLKEPLYIGRVKDKGTGKTKRRLGELVSRDPVMFRKTLEPAVGTDLALQLETIVREAAWRRLEENLPAIRRKLLLRGLRRPLRQFDAARKLLSQNLWNRVRSPSGMMICLVGPDGSGKTSVADELLGALEPHFEEHGGQLYVHGHPPILPRLRTLAELLRLPVARIDWARRPAVSSSVPGQVSTRISLAQVLYYSFNYALAHIWILRRKAAGGMVLFDRYFYDYEISEVRGPGNRLLPLLRLVVPRPDLLFFLSCPPEVIAERKQELASEQVERQQQICRTLVRELGFAAEVSNNRPLDETLKDILNRIDMMVRAR